MIIPVDLVLGEHQEKVLDDRLYSVVKLLAFAEWNLLAFGRMVAAVTIQPEMMSTSLENRILFYEISQNPKVTRMSVGKSLCLVIYDLRRPSILILSSRSSSRKLSPDGALRGK